MKTLPFIPIACLLVTSLAAVEPVMDANVSFNSWLANDSRERFLNLMEDSGWSAEGLTTTDLACMTVIHRNGKIVGYYVVESEWRPVAPDKVLDSEVTKIKYGDSTVSPTRANSFTIEAQSEILLWVAALRNHSRSTHRMFRLVALEVDAGFKSTAFEIPWGRSRDTKGLYFYKGDEEILFLNQHWDKASSAGEPSFNEVLQALVWDRLQKERAENKHSNPEASNATKPKIAPNPKEMGVEQAADGKPQEAPQPPH